MRFRLSFLAFGGAALVGSLMARIPGQSGQKGKQPPEAVLRLSQVVKADEPGLAVMVREGGNTVFAGGFGVRDLRSMKPIDAKTNFRLASCSKQFTAMAVMLLVHDGKLGYDQTLGALWPDFPEYGKAITIRQLLHHTSGLPDYENSVDALLAEANEGSSRGKFWGASPSDVLADPNGTAQISDRGVYRILQHLAAGRFAPGTRWSYSNSGFVLLGLTVAKVSGQSFPEFLRDRIFAPLHMDATLAHVRGRDTIANRAYGHTREGVFRETDQSSTSATLGDGGVYSNLDDLAKWDDALRLHTLLSAAEMQPALTPGELADGSRPHWPADPGEGENLHPGQPVSYGFGWFLDPYFSRRGVAHPRMWHYGGTTGFRSAIERYAEHALTVVVLANRTDLDAADIAERIAASYLD